MADAETAREVIDVYLAQVGRQLRGLSDLEVAEITAELKSHILERAAEQGPLTPASAEAAIQGLGPVRELARGYATARITARVDERRSPWQVIRTAGRLMAVSTIGLVIFLGSLVGYMLAFGFFAIAVLKPLFPDQVGFWTSADGDFSLGLQPHTEGQEHLGWSIIPLCLVLGGACLYLTWRFGLASLRRLRRQTPTPDPVGIYRRR
jgi:hypothetical protein